MGWKAAGIRVVLEAVKAYGFGLGDQCSQDPAAGRKWPDGLSHLLGDADVYELDESAVLSEYPQGCILRPGALPRDLSRSCEQLG